MLAFGIEAKKVIPYLDGVQNAVAAAGGSNVEIEGIVATMSKIQSSSKITATDLIEFGNRGVNAADLIGSQMGKTGAQIRADITAGSLGAEEALDALTAGMSSKFSGAADNVKNTFAGSMDRVKAAWRDFASELATPLVDPNGGGALVDLLNWTADMMRGFQGLPEPIKFTVSALTGLVGVGSLAGGTVYGRGGMKSDSINVNLSRGEEVIQEPYASMYRPQLKQLKQMNRGDFVAGQQQPQVIVASGSSGGGQTFHVTIPIQAATVPVEEQVLRAAARLERRVQSWSSFR